MKFLFYSFLIYWIYNRFFAPPAVKRPDQAPPQSPHYSPPPTDKGAKNSRRHDDGEFIDYEEIK